jgi:ArsR family transcriptional regulator
VSVSPEQFAKALADQTRLRVLVLLTAYDELCVCDFTAALALAQPKVSRHLAVLREHGILLDRRAGQWIHYRLHPELPDWSLDALRAVARGCQGRQPFETDRQMVAAGAATLACCRD